MIDETHSFLLHILPNDGFYVGCIIADKREARNHFFQSTNQLCDWLLRNDAIGQTVYHACASFKESKHDPRRTSGSQRRYGRTHNNIRAIKSFWLDVDAGEGKPYADKFAAIQAISGFCATIGIPCPTLVASGNGIHCYWPLDRELDFATWQPLARGLQALANKHQLHVDPVRTSDGSSILRTPGTHWRKADVRKVVASTFRGPYPLEQFEVFRHAVTEAPARKVRSTLGAHPTWIDRAKPQITAAVADIAPGPPRYAGAIAAGCAHIEHFRATEGNVPEPRWYHALGVLGYCEDGEQKAHEWSSGYPGYTHAETQAKIEQWQGANSGATTCRTFHGDDPKLCEACPHWKKIKSPIALGYEPQELPSAPMNGFHALALGPLPQLPQDYAWGKDSALVLKAENRHGVGIDIVISHYPIYLHQIHTGEIKGDFNYLFRQLIPQRGWVDIGISAAELYSGTGMAALFRQGANIHDGGQFIRFVKHSVDMHYGSMSRLQMQYDQFGWKDDGTFLYGLTLYSGGPTTSVAMGSEEIKIRSTRWVRPAPKGSLASWQQAANSLFARGCEAQSVALLASFAAPLMRFQSADEGGAIISLVTHKTGTGKTTALAGACSVWAAKDGLSLTNEDTSITKFLSLGALGNLPVVYDEIKSRDPDAIRDFVINFTNGRDKMRATRSGEIKHTAASWQTLLVTASNGSLIDAMSHASKADAPAKRVIELYCTVPDDLRHAYGDKLKNQLYANCGWAGDAYLRWLTVPENLTWAKDALEKYTTQIWDMTKLAPAERFFVRSTGAIAVAGVIVKQLGLLEFSIDRIMQFLVRHITGGACNIGPEANWAADLLGMFLNEHWQQCIVMPDRYEFGVHVVRPIEEPKRAPLVMRKEVKSKRYLISTAALTDWLVKHEVSTREFLKELLDRGIATNTGVLATLAAGTTYPGSRIRCVEINSEHMALGGTQNEYNSNVVPLRPNVNLPR